ncbi:MAG: alanine racemase [Candidatus Omnitrophica bacterium]|jgi:alanine racemase|nr:alanine racemase [Candidatus Omnitrophota bacterium]
MSRSQIPPSVNRADISLPAFRRNLARIRARVAPDAGMLLVVKSDAYGHGMLRMAREAAREKGVVYFGVASPEEAVALRGSGIRKPILLLTPPHPRWIRGLVQADISISVSSLEEAARISKAAVQQRRRVKIHAEVDTGMGRLGTDPSKALQLFFSLHKLKSLELEGAYTHFPCADEHSPAICEGQIAVFGMAVELFRDMHPGALRYAHTANSAALFRLKQSHFNLVRPGLSAYGVDPMCGIDRSPRSIPDLEPVMSLKTKIAFLKEVPAGTCISYRSTYKTRARSVIATLPIGYSSGYSLRLSNQSKVLIRGRFFPVAGRVTMDQIMVDLGSWKGARLWEDVVLIGKSGQRRISAEELARLSGTIPYETLCGIHPKVPRIYSS